MIICTNQLLFTVSICFNAIYKACWLQKLQTLYYVCGFINYVILLYSLNYCLTKCQEIKLFSVTWLLYPKRKIYRFTFNQIPCKHSFRQHKLSHTTYLLPQPSVFSVVLHDNLLFVHPVVPAYKAAWYSSSKLTWHD